MKLPKTAFLASLASLVAVGLSVDAAVFKFELTLDGAQEFPGPGDPDGSGLATLWFDDVALSVAWNITVENIDPVTAAHIHIGDAGASGPVRIDFAGALVGSTIDPDVLLVLANPSGYYVNVHNAAFPAGAIRGQIPRTPVAVPEGGSAAASLGMACLAIGGLIAGRRSLSRQ